MNRIIRTNKIDSYLGSYRVNRDVDVIDWWKNNQATYPRLTKIHSKDWREIFSVSMQRQFQQSDFSKAGLIIRKYRNRLNNKSVRLL